MKSNDELREVLISCLNEDSDVPMSAASLASCAMKILDPDDSSPPLVSYSNNLNLRQMAREILRRTFDPTASMEDEAQVEMFERLQDRYPVHRQTENKTILLYVKRMQMTYEERMFNLTRMAREIESKQKHYDALMAETLSLADSGFFDSVSGA